MTKRDMMSSSKGNSKAVRKAVSALERLRHARQLGLETYAAVSQELYRPELATAVNNGIGAKRCVCILNSDGYTMRVPETTEAECVAAAAMYGLKSEWVCEETKLPKFLSDQFKEAWSTYERLEFRQGEVFPTARSRFFMAVGMLIIWFFGGPFLGQETSVRFVVQGFGMLLVAYGVGALRVLQYLTPLRRELKEAKMGLIRIKDELGVDLSTNRGNPVEITKELSTGRRQEFLHRLDDILAKLSNVDDKIETSVYDAYVDVFNTIRAREERNDSP